MKLPQTRDSLNDERGGTMNTPKFLRTCFLAGTFILVVTFLTGQARSTIEPKTSSQHDGQHDFDFNFGTWKTSMKRLQHPLTGSTTWVELNGTVVVRKVWDGRAQLEEVEADGPAGHFEDLGLFLYSPEAHQWSLNFANSKVGVLELPPTIGEFTDGRGVFYDQETLNGRAIMVRIIWSDITPDSHKFEQAFSDDGGKTWEPNVIATLTREKP
jgi:hypothetical protein